MGKVGDRLKEYVALIRLMQPIGKLRLQILGGYAFIFLIVLGILGGIINLVYIISCIVGVLVVMILFILYIISQV